MFRKVSVDSDAIKWGIMAGTVVFHVTLMDLSNLNIYTAENIGHGYSQNPLR